ncbi:two-component regulator propeller domain-containing protein [bacterium]
MTLHQNRQKQKKNKLICFLIFFLFGILGIPLFSQIQHFDFNHLGTDVGLSMNNVHAITRDQYGFMWFGTEDGLNRYDGYQFTIYRQVADDPHSLTNSFIRALIYDSKNRLWIATRDGLCRYVPERDHFIRYESGMNDSLKTANSDIQTLFEDSKGKIWMGGEVGIDCLDPETGIFRHFLPDPENPNSLSHNTIYQIKESKSGLIWIATENGLNLLDPNLEKFQHYFPDPKNRNSISSNYVRSLLVDDQDNLWIGTYENGLDYYDTKNNKFIHFKYGLGKENSLSNYQVNDMAFHWDGNLWVCTTEGLNFLEINRNRLQSSKISQYLEDPNNSSSLSASHIQEIWMDSTRIWLATRFGGVNIYDKYGSKFRGYTTVSMDGNGLSHSNVTSFTTDNQGRTYTGTDGGGVNIFDPQTGKFRYLMHNPNNSNSLTSNKVLSVLFEPPNTLWVGMWSGGLNRYNIRSGQIKHYRNNPNDPSSISSDNVFYLFLDHNNQFWVGTWSGGLNKYNRSTDSFTRYSFNVTDGTGTSGETIISMFEDNDKRLWLATEGQGLNYFDRDNNQFIYFLNDEADSTTISGDYAIAVLQDSQDRFWVTTTNGLNLFNPETGVFTAFHKEDGLPAETLYGILEDDNGNLWISSIQGLSKITVSEMNGQTSIQCTNYTIQDGLQGEQYNQWAYFKDQEGVMYFGGLNGYNVFHPDDIRQNPIPPKVLINGFQLSLKPVSFQEVDSPLQKPVYLTDEITLNYKESMLTFEFVGISFTQPEKNQYAYRLDNFDKEDEWHYVGTERKATYTNLDPKQYTFQIKAANNAGIWNKTYASIRIVIPPPFWKTKWFITLIIIFGIALATGLYQWRTNAIRRKNEHLEAEVAARTEEVIKRKNEIEQAYNRMNEAVTKIKESIQKMTVLADTVAETSIDFNDTSQRLAASASEQASSISEMSTSLQELFTSASANASNAQDTNVITNQTQNLTSKSLDDMNALSSVMKLIHHATNETEAIIRTMEEISTMTQMLSVNASIEAMRAGEYGKGFQAVAKEIQGLADQSETAVQSTKMLIHNAIEHVEKGTKINKDVVKRFKALGKYIEQITGLMSDISAASVQQKLGIDQINTGVDQLNQVMKMSTDAANQTVERSEQLSTNSEELRSLVNILTDATKHLTGERS